MSDQKQIMQLKGWPAVLAILALIAFGAWKMFGAHSTVETGAADKLKSWIQAEYHRENLERFRDTPELLHEKVQQVEALEFRSIAGRGSPDDMVVRVEVAPNEAEPAGTKRVRYFRMRHSTTTGWHLRHEVGVVNWWLAWI